MVVSGDAFSSMVGDDNSSEVWHSLYERPQRSAMMLGRRRAGAGLEDVSNPVWVSQVHRGKWSAVPIAMDASKRLEDSPMFLPLLFLSFQWPEISNLD